jgi:hypothetical protein
MRKRTDMRSRTERRISVRRVAEFTKQLEGGRALAHNCLQQPGVTLSPAGPPLTHQVRIQVS